MPIQLTPEQHDAVYCRGRDTLVSAAAGSGKTRVIVERILSKIIGPERQNINDFLVITFTNAAAAELRDRFEREISARIADDPSNKHLRRQLALLSKAQITTIDAFCFSVLREFSHLCDLNPTVKIVEGAEADLLRTEALENTLESLYEQMDELPDFIALAGLMSAARDDRTLSDAIADASVKIQSHPFPEDWMQTILHTYETPSVDFGETVWGKFLLEEAISKAEHAVRFLQSALDLLCEEPTLAKKYTPTFQSDIELAKQFILAAKKGWDCAAAAAEKPVAKLASAPPNYFDPAFRDRMKNLRDAWKKIYDSIGETISESSEAHLAEIERILPAIRGLFLAVQRFEQEFRRMKTARNLVDFNDVSHTVIKLLCKRSETGQDPTEIAELIGSRYAEVLIDEFQDTNGIQTLISDMITRGRNNLFMVGDVKQSIYRFRLAEPEIFLHFYQTFADYSEHMKPGIPARTVLSRNFRSGPEVIDAVNSVFSRLMIGGFTQITYGEKERLYKGRESLSDTRDPSLYRPEFLVIDVPKSEDEEEDSIGKTEAEALYVAGRIREMLDMGYQIEENGAMRSIRPEDIAILLRSASTKASYFERALAAYGIESSTERSGAIRTAELLTISSILTVIDNAYQDIPLIGMMTSPVCQFTTDELAEVRLANRSASMFEAVQTAARHGHQKCIAFLERLAEFRAVAADSGVDRLIRHIYSVTGLPGIFSAMEEGASRRRNLMRYYEHAVSYEASGRSGIYGFINYMEKVLEKGTFGGESAVSDSVQIMTIHKSKGMEFPVVFLCDLSSKFNMDDTRKHVLIHPVAGIGLKLLDQDRMYQYPTAVYTAISQKIRQESLAEEMRILYVAMTRAKDKLIMTCALPEARNKLQSILKNAAGLGLEQIRSADGPAKWLIPLLVEHPSGKVLRGICGDSSFLVDQPGNWMIDLITTPASDEKDEHDEDDTVEPIPVDAEPIDFDASNSIHTDLPSIPDQSFEDPSLDSVSFIDPRSDVIRDRLAYRYPTRELSKIPSKLTATQLKGKAFESELTEDTANPVSPRKHLERPRFVSGLTGLTPTEKGTALHLAMQFINLQACKDLNSIQKEIERLRDRMILTDQQAEAVDAEKILRFVESSVGQRVFTAYTADFVRREFKFSILDECSRYYPDVPAGEKILVQGVCDLYFEEEGELVVVDFKSDRVTHSNVAARVEEYRPQISLYSYALEKITRKKVKEAILYFFMVDQAITI